MGQPPPRIPPLQPFYPGPHTDRWRFISLRRRDMGRARVSASSSCRPASAFPTGVSVRGLTMVA